MDAISLRRERAFARLAAERARAAAPDGAAPDLDAVRTVGHGLESRQGWGW